MKYITVLIVLCFTILFAYDYFPNIFQVVEVSNSLFIFLVIGLFLVSMIFNMSRGVNSKVALKWQVFITAYILFLMVLFTILGGESSIGISYKNGFFWLVLLISLFEILFQFKKVKGTKSQSI